MTVVVTGNVDDGEMPRLAVSASGDAAIEPMIAPENRIATLNAVVSISAGFAIPSVSGAFSCSYWVGGRLDQDTSRSSRTCNRSSGVPATRLEGS